MNAPSLISLMGLTRPMLPLPAPQITRVGQYILLRLYAGWVGQDAVVSRWAITLSGRIDIEISGQIALTVIDSTGIEVSDSPSLQIIPSLRVEL